MSKPFTHPSHSFNTPQLLSSVNTRAVRFPGTANFTHRPHPEPRRVDHRAISANVRRIERPSSRDTSDHIPNELCPRLWRRARAPDSRLKTGRSRLRSLPGIPSGHPLGFPFRNLHPRRDPWAPSTEAMPYRRR